MADITTYPAQVTAGSYGARFRTGPATTYPIKYSFGAGYKFTVVGFVNGETVDGENRWWKVNDGTYVWVGATIEKPATIPTPSPSPSTSPTISPLIVPSVSSTSAVSTVPTMPSKYDSFRQEIYQLIDLAKQGVYGTTGAREKIYNIIVQKYPEYAQQAGDIIYTELPDGWEIKYGLIKPTPTQIPAPTPTPTTTTTASPTTTAVSSSEFPKTITAGPYGARFRISPSTTATIVYSIPAGKTFTAIGIVIGESVDGNPYWYKTIDGYYVWTGISAKEGEVTITPTPSPIEKYVCFWCGQEFGTKAQLDEHMKVCSKKPVTTSWVIPALVVVALAFLMRQK
jgi:hypothetical protein